MRTSLGDASNLREQKAVAVGTRSAPPVQHHPRLRGAEERGIPEQAESEEGDQAGIPCVRKTTPPE